MKTLKQLLKDGAVLVDTHGKYKLYELDNQCYIVRNKDIIYRFKALPHYHEIKNNQKTATLE